MAANPRGERVRVYTAFPMRTFPANGLPAGKIRHGRDTESPREKIARPYGATPRRAGDWQ